MNTLYQRLPKDLVYIIEDYAKDRTNYNKVIKKFEYHVLDHIMDMFDESEYCACERVGQMSDCDFAQCFKTLKEYAPKCYDKHMECLNSTIKCDTLRKYFLSSKNIPKD